MSRSHVYFVKGVKPSFTKYTLLHSDGFESLQCEKNTDTQMGIRVFWQRMRDSNPRKRSQSPVCYRYTNPLYGGDNRTRTCDLMRVKHAL